MTVNGGCCCIRQSGRSDEEIWGSSGDVCRENRSGYSMTILLYVIFFVDSRSARRIFFQTITIDGSKILGSLKKNTKTKNEKNPWANRIIQYYYYYYPHSRHRQTVLDTTTTIVPPILSMQNEITQRNASRNMRVSNISKYRTTTTHFFTICYRGEWNGC